MHPAINKGFWLAAAFAAVLGLAVGAVYAHEGREVGDYNINIGWIVEPAYEGFLNGVEVRIARVTEGGDDHGESASMSESDDSGSTMMMAADHHDDSGGVTGLEKTLQVEVVYVSTGASRVLNLTADATVKGRYTGDLLPTTPGVYEFRVFGTIEGMVVDETFASLGGGGGFDDIHSTAELQFPDRLPSNRELESAVRGAISTAEQAQDAAEEGPDVLPILALALAVSGLVLGAAGLTIGLRRR